MVSKRQIERLKQQILEEYEIEQDDVRERLMNKINKMAERQRENGEVSELTEEETRQLFAEIKADLAEKVENN